MTLARLGLVPAALAVSLGLLVIIVRNAPEEVGSCEVLKALARFQYSHPLVPFPLLILMLGRESVLPLLPGGHQAAGLHPGILQAAPPSLRPPPLLLRLPLQTGLPSPPVASPPASSSRPSLCPALSSSTSSPAQSSAPASDSSSVAS